MEKGHDSLFEMAESVTFTPDDYKKYLEAETVGRAINAQ